MPALRHVQISHSIRIVSPFKSVYLVIDLTAEDGCCGLVHNRENGRFFVVEGVNSLRIKVRLSINPFQTL